MLQAIDIMNENIVTVRPDWSVRKVTELLLDEDVGSLPVVDETGRMIGLVTESVILLAAVDPQQSSDPISLHMERKFISISPDEPVGQITEKFLLHRVRHFPVTNNRMLLGIVTRRDLMRAFLGRKSEKDLV